MTRKSATSSFFSGGLQGGASGATLGASLGGPMGALIGGGAGSLLGGIGGLFSDSAEEEARENDPEYQAAVRRERAARMFSANLGKAMKAMKTPKLGGPVGI